MSSYADGRVHLRCGAFSKQFKLSWTQQNTLEKEEQHVLVAGAPGTGKTTVLLCKGIQWLEQGRDVVVCSLHQSSVPTSSYLYTVLSEASAAHHSAPQRPEDPPWGKVHCFHTDLANHHSSDGKGDDDSHDDDNVRDDDDDDGGDDVVVRRTVRSMEKLVRDPTGCNPAGLLLDYMAPDTVEQCKLAVGILARLKRRVAQLCVWISDWYSTVPDDFTVHHLTTPLRYTQPIYDLIKVTVDALEMNGQLPAAYNYSTAVYRQPAEGPDVIHLRHKGGNDVTKWPLHSQKCGRQVAKVLREIGVGRVGAASDTGSQAGSTTSTSDQGYQFRDVVILTRNPLRSTDNPPFVTGLREAGIPTSVIVTGDNYVITDDRLRDVILAPDDKVTVTNSQCFTGLDRRVVVCLTGAADNESWQITPEEEQQLRSNQIQAGTVTMGDATLTLTLDMNKGQKQAFRERLEGAHRTEMEVVHRLTMWTRCCRQLVVVHLPQKMQGPREFSFHRDSGKCALM